MSSIYNNHVGRTLAVENPGHVDYDYSYANNVTAIRENGATSGAGVLAQYSIRTFIPAT